MADAIPQSLTAIGRKATPGEKQVFELLKTLPDDCIVWYEIILHELNFKPDFMVLDPRRGIYIIEVKDWNQDTIKSASLTEFRVQMRGKTPVRVRNPQLKCQRYLAEAKERLSLIEELTDNYRLIIPVDYFVAFPNLWTEDYDAIKLDRVISREHVLLKNDLRHLSAFNQKIEHLLPPLDMPISSYHQMLIRNELRDEITISGAPANGQGLHEKAEADDIVSVYQKPRPADVFAIDLEQEKLAKSIGEGPRLIRGVAGSGKTLILLIRAKLIASNAEHVRTNKKILILCWNISLASYMRQMLDDINFPLSNSKSIEITHFMGWAREVITCSKGKTAFPSVSEPNFEASVTRLLKSIKVRPAQRYDAIYIDEIQDFDHEWVRILFHNFLQGRRPGQKQFIAAGDYLQQIITSRQQIGFRGQKVTWAQLKIPMQGRSRILWKVYRNSARIWSFAGLFYGDIKEAYLEETGKAPEVKIKFAPKKGHDPELIACDSPAKQIQETIQTIREITKEYSPRNILILYRKRVLPDGYKIVDELVHQLEKHEIAYQWISEDNTAKAHFDWAHDSVKISTVHSAKGLDAPVVIILGAESFSNPEENTDEIKLMYVAITRAREYIKILYSSAHASEIVTRLKIAFQTYQTYRHRILLLEGKLAGSG